MKGLFFILLGVIDTLILCLVTVLDLHPEFRDAWVYARWQAAKAGGGGWLEARLSSTFRGGKRHELFQLQLDFPVATKYYPRASASQSATGNSKEKSPK